MIITTMVITINNVFTALFPLVCMQASGEHVLGNECVTRALFVAGIFSFFPDWIPRSEVSWSHWAGCWERENPHRWCFKIPPGGEEFFGDALSSIIFFQAYYYCCCCCCCCCWMLLFLYNILLLRPLYHVHAISLQRCCKNHIVFLSTVDQRLHNLLKSEGTK